MKTCCRILTPVAAVHEMKDPSSFLCQRPGVHASGGREIHSKSSSVAQPDMAVSPLHIVTELVWLAASSIEHDAVLPSSSSVGRKFETGSNSTWEYPGVLKGCAP
jgi:hypothetical protein